MFTHTLKVVYSFLIFSGLFFITVVDAHFHLQYPAPRGPFNMANEVNFCDSYTEAVDNRTSFPLDHGYITLTSGHPKWTAAVLISISQDPTNFTSFNTSSTGEQLPLAVPFFSATGEGGFCIPVDIGLLKIPGVGEGSNVTIQVEYDAGDGNLFQCADLTLSSTATIPSSFNCTNVVGNGTSSSPTSTPSNGATTSSIGVGVGASWIFSVLALFFALL